MRRWLREPLLHFLGLGLAIFLAYGWLRGDAPGDDEIVVTRGQQQNLIATFERTWQRPPTPDEFGGLVRDFIRQEIAYRESTAMELDRDDIVIRRRLRQKLELLTEDLSSLAPPTEDELRAFYTANEELFLTEPRFTFEQIYFTTDNGGADAALGRATELLQQIRSGALQPVAGELGDRISLPSRMSEARQNDVAATFGSTFTEQLAELAVGVWAGPVPSSYGVHLVFLARRLEGFVPPLEEISNEVRNELLYRRRNEAVDLLYETLAERYTISIEPVVETAAGQE